MSPLSMMATIAQLSHDDGDLCIAAGRGAVVLMQFNVHALAAEGHRRRSRRVYGQSSTHSRTVCTDGNGNARQQRSAASSDPGGTPPLRDAKPSARQPRPDQVRVVQVRRKQALTQRTALDTRPCHGHTATHANLQHLPWLALLWRACASDCTVNSRSDIMEQNRASEASVRVVEVDDSTYRSLEFAGRIAGISAGEVVARLVAEVSMPGLDTLPADKPDGADSTAVFAIYDGHRTRATYDRQTTRIDIVSGPLAGRSFKTPSAAARAVVAHYKPTVSANRNGWTFWTIDDGTGQPLEVIRSARTSA
jgi:hypothetical protein